MNYIALLRGAPITVFVAIVREGGVCTTMKLVRITGYSTATVAKACRQLCEAGIATENITGWHLLERSPQMLLGIEQISGEKFLPDVVVLKEVKDLDSSLTALTGKISLLREAGVGEPTRTALAKEGYCTVEYLSAHINYWRRSPNLGVGILVNRLKNNDPVPDDPNDRGKYYKNDFSDSLEL